MEVLKSIFQIDDGSIFSDATMGVMWNPLILLLVFVVVCLVIYFWGKLFFREDYNKDSDQVKPFNSGNKDEINYNVPSANLYWGFKKALKAYYKVLENMHTGDLTDYIKWMVITIAICLLLVNGGLL